MRRRSEDEIMCATSEANQDLVSGEVKSIDIGLRLQEAFDYDSVPDMAISLKSNTDEVSSLVEGRSLPTAEILLGVRKLTGVSIDWLLTGEGPKFVAGPAVDRYSNKPLPVWAITQLNNVRRAA